MHPQKRKLRLTLLLILFLILFIAKTANAKWQIYKNQQFNIEFLTISEPKEFRLLDDSKELRVLWHIGFMEDELSGGVEAHRLKDGSLRGFSVTENAPYIRDGFDQSLKSKVVSQKNIFVNSVPAIEFRTTTTSKKGILYHGVARVLLIDDTMYKIFIISKNKDRLIKEDVAKYLDSLRVISKNK